MKEYVQAFISVFEDNERRRGQEELEKEWAQAHQMPSFNMMTIEEQEEHGVEDSACDADDNHGSDRGDEGDSADES